MLDHIVIEICEGCEGMEETPGAANMAIDKLMVSADLLMAAIDGIRKHGGSNA